MPNGSVVQASVTAARRWKDGAKKTVEFVDDSRPTRWSGLVDVGHREVDLSAGTYRPEPLTSISDDEDLGGDGRTAVKLSDNEDYDADVDEELNASSRLMLSRIIVSKLRAALRSNATREHSRIDEEDRHDDDEDDDETVRYRTKCERVMTTMMKMTTRLYVTGRSVSAS